MFLSGKQFIALSVNPGSRSRIQVFSYPKRILQFKVGPVKQWIPHRLGYRFSPGLKLLFICCITRDETLIDTSTPHGTPFVMVLTQPNPGHVLIFPVGCNFKRGKMGMIINDRLFCSNIVVEFFSKGGLQQEIFLYKAIGG